MIDMSTLIHRLLALALLIGCATTAQSQKKYSGPKPPKADLPYLLHAGVLVETESLMAKESQEKNAQAYTIAGATSPARTPLTEPIFLFQSDKLNPDKLSLFKLEVRNGNRMLILPEPGKRAKKDGPRPLFLMVTPLTPGLFRVEVNEFLENGEYCLSPDGSNQVFCFTTF
jgi:hypothetical protein